ncbi:hypothetical protein BJ878DRAFT_544292 [Calycina marina]|uniref:Uncharacterized protein n=1 Tax=Calycina marina TaxID=1763456 RepID=A0A9P8CDA9_9HELO|nr:hypothetical protein BJ878DRAFT_544292 [Calycina marina]
MDHGRHSRNEKGSKKSHCKHSRHTKEVQRTAQTSHHTREGQPRDSNANGENHGLAELGGNENYIRNWISRTHQESRTYPSEQKLIQEHIVASHGPAGQTRAQAFQGVGQIDSALDSGLISRRRRRNSLSDSSLLEPAEPVARSTYPRIDEVEAKAYKSTRNLSHKKQKQQVSVSKQAEEPSYRKETFEKRPRHKTRENLYDPKRREEKNDPVEKRTKNREKRGDKRKAVRKAGEDLMNNFTSKNVGQDRLTMRPSQGLGLFKNGRASSLTRRHGLPDLAFSEMEFLHHSNHQQPAHAEKNKSKSQEKSARRSNLAYDEMSTFFKPDTKPLEGIGENARARRSSSYITEGRPRDNYLTEFGGMGNTPMVEDISYPTARQYLGFGKSLRDAQRSSSHEQEQRQQQMSDDHDIDIRSLWSGKETTCITWSETQLSPTAKLDSRQDSPCQLSPAPELVRKSIEMSGVLEGTGITLTPELRGRRISGLSLARQTCLDSGSPASGAAVRRHSDGAGSNTISKSRSWLSSSCRDVHPISRSDEQRQTERKNTLNDQTEASRIPETSLAITSEVPMRITKHIIVEHYDPVIGWHQRQTPGIKSPLPCESSAQARSMQASRQELAARARIKRPSTTLPVTRIRADQAGGHSDGSEGGNSAEDVARSISLPNLQDCNPCNVNERTAIPTSAASKSRFSTPGFSLPLGEEAHEHNGSHSRFQVPSHGSEHYLSFIAGHRMNESDQFTNPHRGSWIDPRQDFILQPVPLSSILESDSLYMSQIRSDMILPPIYHNENVAEIPIQYSHITTAASERVSCADPLQYTEYIYSDNHPEVWDSVADPPGAAPLDLELEHSQLQFATPYGHSGQDMWELAYQSHGELVDAESGLEAEYGLFTLQASNLYSIEQQYETPVANAPTAAIIGAGESLNGFWKSPSYF